MKPENIEIKNRALTYEQKTSFWEQRRDFYWRTDAARTRNQNEQLEQDISTLDTIPPKLEPRQRSDFGNWVLPKSKDKLQNSDFWK